MPRIDSPFVDATTLRRLTIDIGEKKKTRLFLVNSAEIREGVSRRLLTPGKRETTRVNAVLGWLQRIESLVAATAYGIVAGLLLGEIVARELFAASIWGSQRMAVFAAILAGFLGLSLTTGTNGHLRAQFADRWVPESWRPMVERLGDFVSAAIYLALAVIALGYIGETYENGDQASVLYWPLWPLQLILPYAFASSAFRHVVFGLQPSLKPEPTLMDN